MEVGGVMEENVKEPMIVDDPSDNLSSNLNFPLYETEGAGLTSVVEGMLEMGAGFRTTDIAEAGKRVEEARRQLRLDTLTGYGTVVGFFVMCFLML